MIVVHPSTYMYRQVHVDAHVHVPYSTIVLGSPNKSHGVKVTLYIVQYV